MSVITPIVDFVNRYQKSGVSRLHMPGHKGQSFLGFEPFDLTEIQGADELYAPDGIIAESEAKATQLFGTAHTFYSTEGSSQCIRAMLFLALQAASITAAERPVLLAARNAHKSLLYAAALLDFDVEWLWPEHGTAGELCSCPVSGESVKQKLEALAQRGIKPFGVYVTSPDYLGGMQDISAIADACKNYGVPLLVDNAHGAYLRFLPESMHPIELGAAMCCDSGHKTLPVLTGGAYLHVGKNASIQDERTVRNALSLFGSTSPSYLILQSLDNCNKYICDGYRQKLALCVKALEGLRMELNAVAFDAGCTVPLALKGEPLKLTLDAAALGIAGQALAQKLREHKIECEYADPRFVVLMFTPENTPQDYERVREAVYDQLSNVQVGASQPESYAADFAQLKREQQNVCTIRQAVFANQECVATDDALGRVCAMPTVSCPPAIPIAVSGEKIGAAAVALMKHYGIDTVAVIK